MQFITLHHCAQAFYVECLLAECEDSDESSGEVDIEQETSDPEDGRELDPNTLLNKASRARNMPVMAEALAHGADVNSVSEEDENKSPLIQAVTGVRRYSSHSSSIKRQLAIHCFELHVKVERRKY